MPPTNDAEFSKLREKALNAIRKALDLGPEWTSVLLRQFLSSFEEEDGTPKAKEEGDLEIFEDDAQFRAVLGADVIPKEPAEKGKEEK